jgi:hypothetical protein
MVWQSHKEHRVENVFLSIPYRVLSTEYTLAGDVSEHILTPFGTLDVCFPALSASRHPNNPMEIEVQWDLGSWMVWKEAPQEFSRTLPELVLKMVSRRWVDRFPPGVSVRFNGALWEAGIQERGSMERRDEAL